jgi:hypothetical protein
MMHSLLWGRLCRFQVEVPFKELKEEHNFMVAHKLDAWRAEKDIQMEVLFGWLVATVLPGTVVLIKASTSLDNGVNSLEPGAVLFSALTRVLPLNLELAVDVQRRVFCAVA